MDNSTLLREDKEKIANSIEYELVYLKLEIELAERELAILKEDVGDMLKQFDHFEEQIERLEFHIYLRNLYLISDVSLVKNL